MGQIHDDKGAIKVIANDLIVFIMQIEKAEVSRH
jgi:hypothetical protein